MLQSYQACVVPAGHFACEVWGVLPLRPAVLLGRRGQFGRFAPATFKKLVGLRQMVPTPMMLADLRQSCLTLGCSGQRASGTTWPEAQGCIIRLL